MALLMSSNQTCDIYRAGNAPPSAPDVSQARCFLAPKGQSTLTTLDYTHVLYVDVATDIRDGYNATLGPGTGADVVWIPNKNGTPFNVCLVRRIAAGQSGDSKQVLLQRASANLVPWPTNNL